MPTDDVNKIFSVSELTNKIKGLLEPALRSISVKGEISNFKRQSSGHLYFSLKDKNTQISAVFFCRDNQNLTKLPKDGDQVIVKGEISVYPPRGNYQLIIRELQLAGIGDLLLKLHDLKEKLKRQGLFDPSHKKPLPSFPKKIGVITSPTGAVLQDILHVLSRRFVGFHLILNPVKVQGEKASIEITRAIEDFNRFGLVDVLIVARGGGSLEDLWAFNEEILAHAIHHSKIPVVSAVGHETDYTIADLVADVRAPTPSSAAEIVSKEQKLLRKSLFTSCKTMDKTMQQRLKYLKQRHSDLMKQPIFSKPIAMLTVKFQNMDEVQNKTQMLLKYYFHSKKHAFVSLTKNLKSFDPIKQIKQIREKLEYFLRQITQSAQTCLQQRRIQFAPEKYKKMLDKCILEIHQKKKASLEHLIQVIHTIDPKNLLKKGYSILFSEIDGSIILSAKQLKKEDRVHITLKDGTATSQIIDVKLEKS